MDHYLYSVIAQCVTVTLNVEPRNVRLWLDWRHFTLES